MMCSVMILVPLLLALTVSFPCMASVQATDVICPHKCKCENSQMECEGIIPDIFPRTIKEVILTFLDITVSFKSFCHNSWNHVIKLSLIELFTSPYYKLSNRPFSCLANLQSLKYSSRNLKLLSDLSFYGPYLTELDLSGCQDLLWSEIYKILSIQLNFPNLTHLDISHGYHAVLPFDQNFTDALATRPITQLDLSGNSLALIFTNASKLCKTLKTVFFKKVYIESESDYRETCKSIQTVDMSGSRELVSFFEGLTCVNISVKISLSNFFSSAKVLYINQVVPYPKTIDTSYCYLEMYVNDSVKELHFTQNNFPTFDVIFMLSPTIQFLNLSHNRIENLHRFALIMLPTLKAIDLSNNNLSNTHQFEHLYDNPFYALFRKNKKLNMIDMSFNKLTVLPTDTFICNNDLQQLYLSNNFIREITFNISHLINLTTLDLRFNSIKAFNETSRRFLTSLYENQTEAHNNVSFELLLEGNPLSCECSSLEFLQWFMSSPILTNTRHNYHCSLEGQEMQINENAIKAAKEECEKFSRRIKRVLLSTLIPTTVVSAMAMTTIYLYRRHQRRLIWQRYTDRVRLLRENNVEFQFPVFLSYCSVDNEFVTINVLRPLQRRLKTITNINRDLVCYADRHFVPGCTILSEMVNWLENSSVFIAVITSDYCASNFCKFEIEQAHLMRKPIILILKEHVEERDMSPITKQVFQHFTRVKCVFEDGQHRIQPDWKEICDAIIQLM